MITLIAHRGASAEAPENTLAAIQRAIDLKVDCIEMDLHLTKDLVPVVIHDSSLARTTNCLEEKKIEDLTFHEVKQLDAGSWFSPQFAGERIPTLKEIIALDRKGCGLMLEVKKGVHPPAVITEKILAELPKHDATIRIGSFEPDIVEAFQSSRYSLIGIVEEPQYVRKFVDMGVKHLAVWSLLVSPRLVDMLHCNGITVWTFTVDDMESCRHLFTIGVDGIITNNPSHIRPSLNP